MSSTRKRIAAAIALVLLVAAAVWWGPRWLTAERAAVPHQIKISDGSDAPVGMVWVPTGEFLMGSDSRLAQANEKPTHRVRVDGFWMDQTHVTNAQFAAFVNATDYKTTAERKPDWETIKVQLPPGIPKPPESVLVPGAMVFTGTQAPTNLANYWQWWSFVPGANWQQPQGPGSSIKGKEDHPVVQVSYEDVLAYAKWAGKQLPSEAQWEYAARGGLEQATYVWGDELLPNGQQQANYWDNNQASFPVVSPRAGGAMGTVPVRTFAPNGYGLYDMTGNAWQWVADNYRADYFLQQRAAHGNGLIKNPQGPSDAFDPSNPGMPVHAPKHVIRGGSFLCNESYCLAYRPSARQGSDPYSPMSHLGFRLIWQGKQP